MFFSHPCCCEATVLQEGIGDHRHERMAVKTLPGAALEVVEAEFLFHLLMRLFAFPQISSNLPGIRSRVESASVCGLDGLSFNPLVQIPGHE